VAGGYLEAPHVKLGAHVLSVVQLGTNRLDVAVAGLLDGVQDAVELAQRTQRVQLDGEDVGIAHRVLGEWDQKAALDTLAADCGVLQLEDEANAAADVVQCSRVLAYACRP